MCCSFCDGTQMFLSPADMSSYRMSSLDCPCCTEILRRRYRSFLCLQKVLRFPYKYYIIFSPSFHAIVLLSILLLFYNYSRHSHAFLVSISLAIAAFNVFSLIHTQRPVCRFCSYVQVRDNVHLCLLYSALIFLLPLFTLSSHTFLSLNYFSLLHYGSHLNNICSSHAHVTQLHSPSIAHSRPPCPFFILQISLGLSHPSRPSTSTSYQFYFL